jgi:hypothetical protein
MELKIGDILICHKPCKMINTGLVTTTIGKYYKIISIQFHEITIIDDQGDIHTFDINEDHECSYTIWFNSIKIMRMKKLKKLKNEEKID